MNRKIYEIIVLVWFLSSVYLIVGAIVFNKASFMGIALITQSQVILLLIILLTAVYIFPKNWERRRWGLIIASIVGLNLLCVLIRYSIEEIIFVRYLGFPETKDLNPLFYVYDNFYYSLPGFFLGFITFLIFKTIAIEKRNSELKAVAKEAELSFLKSQINPHFLYNIFNYMYAVSLPISEKLSETIRKLAGTMRYTLTQSNVQMAPLIDKVEFIQNYIDLQSTQFEQGIYYSFTKKIQDDNILYPTLVLITFIENTFKHGIVSDPKFPLEIVLVSTRKKVTFQVKNHINQQLKDSGHGIGLANVKRRLEILFPSSHSFHISKDEMLYSVHLDIYLNDGK